MSDGLQSPIDRVVSRNTVPNANQQDDHSPQHVSADAIVDALSSISRSDATKSDPLSWATEEEVDSKIDYDDLASKGVDNKTQALIRAMEGKPQAKTVVDNDEQNTGDDLKPVRSIAPKLNVEGLMKSLKLDDMFDDKKFNESADSILVQNPINVPLAPELIKEMEEAGTAYIPALVQRYSNDAAKVGAQLAINHVLSILPQVFEQYSSGLATGVESSSFDSEVLSYFDNDVETLIAKTYAPRYVKKNPSASPAQTAQAVKEFIASSMKAKASQGNKQTQPTASNELGASGNPWFGITPS